MKLNIRPHNALHIVLLDGAPDGDEETFEALLLLIRDPLRCELAGKRLESCADLKDLVDVADGYACHIGSAPRHGHDIALLLELSDCLAHGCAADEELIREVIFLQPFARLQDAAANGIAQYLADNLAKRLIAVYNDR